MKEVHEYFTAADWLVVFGYLALTTWVGHRMRGKQGTIRDFFLGGRSLPWPAVSGSIIATEISGVTFIGVPGMVFALTGNFTYLQWALGSIIARILVGVFFVRVYYEREIYSPYDYMGNQLGRAAKRLATIIFSLGSILGQSVRVLVAALALKVVTGWEFSWCIWVIGAFAIAWTLMGGMRTVIWTDVMQFFLFTLGGLTALFWIVTNLDGGWTDFWRVGSSVTEANVESGPAAGKFSLLDLTTDPAVGFTLWVAIIAAPFLNLNAFGVDQLNAQRMFCCKSAADARKAIIWSSVGQALTLLMLLVGAALYVHYTANPPGEAESALFDKSADYVFPTWITTTLPVGLRGLIIAAIFAAAISSLDSILAALSQTTLSLFVDTEAEHDDPEAAQAQLVRWSRALVVFWGLSLSAFAILLDDLRGSINMVNLAFGMIAYTTGPLLGLFLAALFARRRRSPVWALGVGTALSILLVLFVRTDLYTILDKTGIASVAEIADARWIPVTANAAGDGFQALLHYAWMWPVTCLLTFGCGLLFSKAGEPRGDR